MGVGVGVGVGVGGGVVVVVVVVVVVAVAVAVVRSNVGAHAHQVLLHRLQRCFRQLRHGCPFLIRSHSLLLVSIAPCLGVEARVLGFGFFGLGSLGFRVYMCWARVGLRVTLFVTNVSNVLVQLGYRDIRRTSPPPPPRLQPGGRQEPRFLPFASSFRVLMGDFDFMAMYAIAPVCPGSPVIPFHLFCSRLRYRVTNPKKGCSYDYMVPAPRRSAIFWFTLFTLMVGFVLMNLFIAIVTFSFDRVQQEALGHSKEDALMILAHHVGKISKMGSQRRLSLTNKAAHVASMANPMSKLTRKKKANEKKNADAVGTEDGSKEQEGAAFEPSQAGTSGDLTQTEKF